MEGNPKGRMAADEIVQAAIQMEELGRDFYEALGAVCADRKTRELCKRLANEETHHTEVFRKMRSELAKQGKTVLLTARETADIRRALRSGNLPDAETIRRIAASGKVADLLAMAIETETNTIRYYTEMAQHVSDRAAVQAVIQEEQSHVKNLQTLVERLQQGKVGDVGD